MMPTLRNGDIVFFRSYSKEESLLKSGQIIILNHPLKNKKLIKRIKFVGNNIIQVVGDNVDFSEDSNKFGLINDEKIIGIVTSKLISQKLRNFLSQKKSGTFLNPK